MMNSKTENVILESYSEYFRVFMTRLEVENDTFYDQSVSFCVEVIKNMPFIKKEEKFSNQKLQVAIFMGAHYCYLYILNFMQTCR